MKRITLLIMISSFAVVCSPGEGFALHTETHEYIHEYIGDPVFTGFNLHHYMKEYLGFQKGVNQVILGNPYWWLPAPVQMSVLEWLKKGGTFEDNPPFCTAVPYLRTLNHFHDPLEEDLTQAGCGEGCDAIIWACQAAGEQGYSWHDIREYYYMALTSEDDLEQHMQFSNTFRGLGQIMHLVTDMSVPEHTRDDVHVLGNIPGVSLFYTDYEVYMKNMGDKFPEFLDSMTEAISFPPLITDSTTLNETLIENIQLIKPLANIFDLDRFGGSNPEDTLGDQIGLSEYSNANFLSPDTMFAEYIYPSIGECEIVIKENRKYLKIQQTALGEEVDPIAVVSYVYFWRMRYYPPLDEYIPVGLDDECYDAYAKHLIPRAVGYSSQVLQYFFRGNIEISLPEEGVYAFTDTMPLDPSTQGFDHIRLCVRNISEDGEEMSGGSIQLVVKYSVMSMDPFRNYDPYPLENNEMHCFVEPLDSYDDHVIPADHPLELDFDLGDHPIPMWATDVYFSIVYRGCLGREDGFVEENAVAVGFKDVSEPTLFDVVNTTDYASINGCCCYVGDDEGLSIALNFLGIDDFESIIPVEFSDIYIRFSPASSPEEASSEIGSHIYWIPVLDPGSYTRMYLLTDYQFTASSYCESTWDQTRTGQCSGMRNQVQHNEEKDLCWRLYPPLEYFRGVEFWNRIQLIQHQKCSEEYLEENDGTCPRCDLETIPDDWPLVMQ
ncbi:MAG: hypothetical protein ACP5G0_11455 [Desulfomonilia bacterium]